MTTEEKRMKMWVQCSSGACSKKCPLYTSNIPCGAGASFMSKDEDGYYKIPDRMIEQGYEKMFPEKKKKPTKQPAKKALQDWDPVKTALHDCPFNSGLHCSDPDSKCVSCGWNPAVKAFRLTTIRLARRES